MSKRIPDYLKLHTEQNVETRECPPVAIDSLPELSHAFESATGWQLEFASAGLPALQDPNHGMRVNENNERPVMVLATPPGIPSAHPVEREQASDLAASIGQLVQKLEQTRAALRRREAELAAGIPVTLHRDDREHLADRLEGVLRGGAEAIGCQAAALYLLDDATSHLKLRSCWGLPSVRLTDPPRPLRGAVSDLEALVGHAVALEDAALLPHWRAPEDYPAALCVPVSSSNTPLGTLWFFCDHTREFTNEQTHLAEIIAGRLVADLEREVIAQEHLHTRHVGNALPMLARYQQELEPQIAPLLDGWQFAGRTRYAESVGGNFYDWMVLADGRLAVMLGNATGDTVDAALTATTLITAFRAHANHQHDARQMLGMLNESLWTNSVGDRFAAMWYGLIDPDDGVIEFSDAGNVHAFAASPDGSPPRLLTADNALLGADPDHAYRRAETCLRPGEQLILATPSSDAGLQPATNHDAIVRHAETLDFQAGVTAEQCLETLWPAVVTEATDSGTVVVVRHVY